MASSHSGRKDHKARSRFKYNRNGRNGAQRSKKTRSTAGSKR